MEYEKIAAAAVQVMTGADLHHFPVMCALVSDLFCPGYNPKQPLAKESNLARAAARYKIDTGTAAAALRMELSGPKDKRKDQPNRPRSEPLNGSSPQIVSGQSNTVTRSVRLERPRFRARTLYFHVRLTRRPPFL